MTASEWRIDDIIRQLEKYTELPEGGMSVESVVFVRQNQLCEIILNNLFSEDTNRFFENCEFSSYRTAFMQGMNYAAILCNAKLDQYPAVMVHEPPKEET